MGFRMYRSATGCEILFPDSDLVTNWCYFLWISSDAKCTNTKAKLEFSSTWNKLTVVNFTLHPKISDCPISSSPQPALPKEATCRTGRTSKWRRNLDNPPLISSSYQNIRRLPRNHVYIISLFHAHFSLFLSWVHFYLCSYHIISGS